MKVESLDKKLTNKLERRLRSIRDLHIVSTGGSWEGVCYVIHLDQSVPILLKLSDLPEVAETKLVHDTIQVRVKP